MKCPTCNGCLKPTWVENSAYRYCTLCRTVYALQAGGISIQEKDPTIIKIIQDRFGRTI